MSIILQISSALINIVIDLNLSLLYSIKASEDFILYCTSIGLFDISIISCNPFNNSVLLKA